MDITYITERMIAMTSPEGSKEENYKTALREVTNMLKTKHGENYMVFNLSERRYDVAKLNRQVLDFGWPLQLTPPLERLCSICKAMDSWLTSDPQHIVVLHSKGGKERARVVVAAYMHYSNICASADQALDRFAMKKFYNEKVHGLLQPSQRRYIEYFSGLLSGSIKINSNPLYLQQILIQGTPSYDYRGGCRLFIKVYQGMQQIFTSGVYSVTNTMQKIPITLDSPLQLRGDILVKAYHRQTQPDGRVPVFRCQFHTCAVSAYGLTFGKNELDDAYQDEAFPDNGRVELKFSSFPEHSYSTLKDMSLPVDYSADNIVRADSYENFDNLLEDSFTDTDISDPNLNLNHTSGPIDGNLYATVAKSRAANGFPHHVNGVGSMNGGGGGGVGPIANGFHTISMDSGISSTLGPFGGIGTTPPHSHGTQSTVSTSDAVTLTPTNLFETHAEVHRQPPAGLPDSEEQRKLDELLSGMLADVQSIPDIKTPIVTVGPPPPAPLAHTPVTTSSHTITTKHVTYTLTSGNPYPPRKNPVANGHIPNSNPQFTHSELANGGLPDATDDEDKDLPYHARKDSQPFTYGVPPASPRLQRKVYINPNVQTSPVTYSQPVTYSPAPAPPPPVISSYSPPSHVDDHGFSDSDVSSRFDEPTTGGWLQRQQQKLRERTEARVRGDRYPKEQQLISELRTTQTRINAAKEDPFTTPLHVHTTNGHWQPQGVGKPPANQPGKGGSAPSSPLIPSRLSSRDATRGRYGTWQTQGRSLQRQRSDSSHDRERPFVTVKRAHEQARRQAELQGVNPLTISQPMYSNTTYIYNSPIYQNQPQPQPNQQSFAPISVATSTPISKGSVTPSRTPGLLTTVGGRSDSEPRSSSPVTTQQQLDDLELSLLRSGDVRPRSPPGIERGRSPVRKNQDTFNWTNNNDGSSSPQYSPSISGFGDRPPTPAFPVHPRTPYLNQEATPPPQSLVTGLPPKSPTLSRKERSPSPATVQLLRANLAAAHPHPQASQGFDSSAVPHSANGQSSPSVYFGQSRRSSMISLSEPIEVIHHHPVFVKDLSKYWYKPNISREDAISMLKDKAPGTFLVRDSNSFPGAFGMALKVATPPPNVQNKTGDISSELVRHFLIEPTSKGVKLKGCSNEPVFGSLSALVYQHSITPLALPCKLLLPEGDPLFDGDTVDSSDSAAQLLAQGAACNVLYLFSMDMESLTGSQAVRKAATQMFLTRPSPKATVVHFKVSSQGITLTDNNRKLFFRRHYPANGITYCGADTEDRRWTQRSEDVGLSVVNNQIFGFVARKPTSKTDNQCHLFAELEPEQPASAIINFVTKVMMGSPNSKVTFI